MTNIGVDLHKKTLSVCVVDEARRVLDRKVLHCQSREPMVEFFTARRPFRAVVEATAGYEWFCDFLEPLAEEVILAHPRKLRIIAESTRKSDKLDAQILAEFLAADMIPQAYRPTLRQRQHRALVRQRYHLRQRVTRVKNKMRRILANSNADRPDLFTAEADDYLRASAPISAIDRFVLDQLIAEWDHGEVQLDQADRKLRQFGKLGLPAEREARAALVSIPGVGALTADVVLCEIGDIRRFRSVKQVVAYAGLAPGQRESAGRTKQLGITKQGSRLLRWAVVEAAWRLIRRSPRWAAIHEQIRRRRGKKKATVAIARRLLTVMAAVWRDGRAYDPLGRAAV